MSARVCPVCDAWVLLPRVSDRSIGLRPLRWPHHTRGKVRNAAPCPQSGELLRVWALPEQREAQ
mgnify:CR=1 FL=1